MPEKYLATQDFLKNMLMVAWLAPLVGFAIEIFAGYWQNNRKSKAAAYLAVGCIGLGFVCSSAALFKFYTYSDSVTSKASAKTEIQEQEHRVEEHGDNDHEHSGGDIDGDHDGDHDGKHDGDHAETKKIAFTGVIYPLATFGSLKLSIDYYIDSLTLIMFTMVTLIATCIHVFALGYMSDELTDEYIDHNSHTSDGKHLHRPGRFYRFFSYMSLFCFSMLGLVLAGNIFQVFVFWELVGICSYLLIGFYVERKSASNAANKAFIMNRVGDFGFLIGLMILWTYFGTFQFSDSVTGEHQDGLFQMLRGDHGAMNVVKDATTGEKVVQLHTQSGEHRSIPYWLLVTAGLGIFAGCIGKSAQFPLQTWLPDAMEGPTPVSALVHSATMVAAGVYLAGRFYPMFTPEVLLVIAYIGCITLFLAATIAVVATDIKRVLAYSTISQLGYMMLAIGVAGWGAGLFHLITHAFFKSLMFLASGSVIVGCHHEQEMPRMGGLWKKMPWTAFTMLVGVIAISGLAIPGTTIALSGFYSKDAIVATALSYSQLNSTHFLLYLVPLITAGLTAFYMFRLWFFTFAGKPRDQELHDHAEESPLVMVAPLVVLAIFAACVAWPGEEGPLYKGLSMSQPAGIEHRAEPVEEGGLVLPWKHYVHGTEDAAGHHLPADQHANSPHVTAGHHALIAAFLGMFIAYLLYGLCIINPAEIKRKFAGVHGFLVEKWHFDTLYEAMFEKPVHIVSYWCASIDRIVFDGFLHKVCKVTIDVSRIDRKFDEKVIDGMVNWVGKVCFVFGDSLRVVQTGKLRQYVMFIALGVVSLFTLLFFLFPNS